VITIQRWLIRHKNSLFRKQWIRYVCFSDIAWQHIWCTGHWHDLMHICTVERNLWAFDRKLQDYLIAHMMSRDHKTSFPLYDLLKLVGLHVWCILVKQSWAGIEAAKIIKACWQSAPVDKRRLCTINTLIDHISITSDSLLYQLSLYHT